MVLDFSRCPRPPFAHQREDVEWLMDRPYAFITSEMRTGKSAIIVWTAQFLYETGIIDKVLVVSPAPVRDVWYDETLGQIRTHGFPDVPNKVTEFHARIREWSFRPSIRYLHWIVTGFEFIRSKNRLTQLLPFCTPKTWLVLDESSYVKNAAAQQTKACVRLRKACGRVTLLNGTPLFHSPLDLFSQGNLLSPDILECPYITHFKSRYAKEEAVLGYGGRAITSPHGKTIQKIVGWYEEGLRDLQRRFAPVTVRRLQAECLDLPAKLDPVTLTATMDENEWRVYRDMKEELCVWLKSGDVAVSSTAAIKALRLSQITGGFLGGVEGANIGEQNNDALIDSLELGEQNGDGRVQADTEWVHADRSELDTDHRTAVQSPDRTPEHQRIEVERGIQAIGRSKLDVLLWFIGQQLEANPNFHVICWFRFRPELMRALDAMCEKFPQMTVGALHGGNKKAERREAMRLLHPESSPTGPVFVGGIEGTGSFGVNMTAAHTSIDYSSGYSPGRYLQKTDRIYGPGMTTPCAYYDLVCVGPQGQRTIDHAVIAARRAGQDVASWVAADWVRALTTEK